MIQHKKADRISSVGFLQMIYESPWIRGYYIVNKVSRK